MCEEFKEYKVFLEITEVKGYCDCKHYVGQKIEISTTNAGGLYGSFFAASTCG